MSAVRSVAKNVGYVVTESGKLASIAADRCYCDPKLSGLLLECPQCGTVYGSLRQSFPSLSQHTRDKRPWD